MLGAGSSGGPEERKKCRGDRRSGRSGASDRSPANRRSQKHSHPRYSIPSTRLLCASPRPPAAGSQDSLVGGERTRRPICAQSGRPRTSAGPSLVSQTLANQVGAVARERADPASWRDCSGRLEPLTTSSLSLRSVSRRGRARFVTSGTGAPHNGAAEQSPSGRAQIMHHLSGWQVCSSKFSVHVSSFRSTASWQPSAANLTSPLMLAV